jgi:hypothetical protein
MLVACFTFSSCYTYTSVVGKGAQGTSTVSGKNHYLIDGLVPLKTSDSKAMAGDSKDYVITTEHTFIDGLLSVITFGIYSPTTTTVTK